VDDKAEVEFVYLKVKGGSNALQEAVRTFANTLTRSQPTRAVLPAPATPSRRVPAANDPEPVEEQQPSLFGRDAASDVDVDATAEEVGTPRPARPRVVKARPIPEIIADLDVTTGEVPLAAFIEKKNPETVFEKYLVIAYWLREYRSIPSVTVNHMFTCYRGLKWTPPNDPGSALRDLSKKKRQLMTGDGNGNYTLTILGSNEVERMASAA
jgi:hypothetical protein